MLKANGHHPGVSEIKGRYEQNWWNILMSDLPIIGGSRREHRYYRDVSTLSRNAFGTLDDLGESPNRIKSFTREVHEHRYVPIVSEVLTKI